MGELDRKCIEYFSDAARFADVMNLGLYASQVHGQRIRCL